jgi:aryl-alcohol dehydrogenase-like predicted oxidoreductase
MSKVKRVFGTATFTKEGRGFNTSQQVSQVLDVLKQNGIDELDTARRYGAGTSEELLGEATDFKTFIVSTKANPFSRKLTREDTIAQCDESLKAMNRSSVDIYYLHAPDRSVPFEETAEAINDLYKRGSFKRFGLSNFTAEEVERIYNICKQNNYVLPSVYQGNYNPITRKNEQELFPLLRKLGMHFYAYSPLAGGFLIKTPDQIKNPQANSRFDTSTQVGQLYAGLYLKESFFLALETFQSRCKKLNIKPSEACFSWLLNHSQLKEGDAIILGASSMEQLLENLHDSRGVQLSADMVQELENLWKAVESEAPRYHM